MTMSPVAVAAVPCGLVAGFLATDGAGLLPVIGGLAAALWLTLAAPPRALVWVAGAGVLVSQGHWLLVTSILGGDVYLGDLLAVGALVAALGRAKVRAWWTAPLALIALLGAWAVLRSDLVGEISFARIMLPLVVLLAVVRVLPVGHDLRRDLRWFPIAALISVPLVEDGLTSRWQSIAGGANETGLIAACAIVLGFTYRGGWRYTLWAVGLVLLAGTAAITATIATGAAAVYYAAAKRRPHGVRLGSGSPLAIAAGLAAAAVLLRLLRVDFYDTIDAHLFQISKVDRVLRAGDALLGSGWANADRAAFFDSDISGLHNVYLDVLAQLGAVGLGLLVALLVVAWRRADVVGRALLITWMVWVNTTGAFPGSPWGVLGFVLAFAALAKGSDQVAEQRDDDGLRRAGRRGVDADLDHAARRR